MFILPAPLISPASSSVLLKHNPVIVPVVTFMQSYAAQQAFL